MNTEQDKIAGIFNIDMDVIRIVFRRNWYWIFVLLGLCLSGAFFYLRYTKPVYESHMLIQISSENQGADVLDFKKLDEESSISKEIELLRSELLFRRAIRDLHLYVSYYAEGDVLTETRYGHSNFTVVPHALKDSSLCHQPLFVSVDGDEIVISLDQQGTEQWKCKPNERLETRYFDITPKVTNWQKFVNDNSTNQLYFEFNNLDILVARSIRNLKVTPIDPSAKTIEIKFESHNARFAQDVVQSVGANFFEYDEDFKKESAENVLSFISVQLDSLQRELSESKDNIMAFQRRESLPNAETYSESVEEKLDQFMQDEYEVKSELRTLEMLKAELSSEPNSLEIYQLIPQLLGKSFESSLDDQVTTLQELIERKEDLSYQVTDDHQGIEKMNRRIESRVNYINKIIKTINGRLENKLSVIQKEIQRLEEQYYDLPEKQMELSRLKNIQKLNEKYYTLLTEKKVLYSISNAGYAPQNKILNPPSKPVSPIAPKSKIIYGIASFFGLSLSFGLLLIKYLKFDEINDISELRKVMPSNIGVLGAVPKVRQKMEHSQLLVSNAPKSRVSESFRTIRTNLSFVDKSARTIAVTSSISGEGKTFITLNLGAIIAMSGKTVVILDLDLRKPKVHLGFNGDNSAGMSNVLAGHASIDSVINTTQLEHLSYVSAGPIPPNPSELILSDQFDEVLQVLSENYDMVIIDNPPVGLVSDGINVLSKVDIPIYVFKANYSKRNFVKNVVDIADPKEIQHLNVVLNAESMSKSAYGYGYGGYYSDEKQRRWFKRKR
ncbi:MAG: polysaccharide biosynthesis tyrosine autokinase [Bacteroidota bacterium]